MAIKVKLRKKDISGKRKSLYLDYYPPIINQTTGEPTRREFLGLYILDNAKGPIEKKGNKETMELAEQLRQQRENNINKPEIYSGYEKEQLNLKANADKDFLEYFKAIADKFKEKDVNTWLSAYYYLYEFTNGKLRFGEITEKLCNDFKEHLLTSKSNKSKKVTLSVNSASLYFSKFKCALKKAYKEDLLPKDINIKIEPIKELETFKSYLTHEELNSLVKTECKIPLMKSAAIFSALTGLRFSDIQKLYWSEIEYMEGSGYVIRFAQQKTKGIEYLPISEQAFSLLGERKNPEDKVFEGLTYSAYSNKYLAQWIGLAGINKDITFHCFRHTYATLQLSGGTDLYTVSKMLGHRDIKSTQVYAKIVDKTKREATNKIILDL